MKNSSLQISLSLFPGQLPRCHRWVLLCTPALFFLFGCATALPPDAAESQVEAPPETVEIVIEAEGVAFLEDAGQLSQLKIPNWDRFIEAKGHGFPSTNATHPAQKKLTALAAARYRALAAMVESLDGLQVARESKVENMVFAGENVSINLSGNVQGATTVSESYDEKSESAEVVIRVAMDDKGNLIPHHANSLAPISLYKRRAEAEEAARINASAALRERIGSAELMQHVVVKDLMLQSQEAQLKVNGLLEGATYSDPEWDNKKCVVKASLAVRVKNPDLSKKRYIPRAAQSIEKKTPSEN
jgi:hypothetical protein